jgi:hypothetical protein
MNGPPPVCITNLGGHTNGQIALVATWAYEKIHTRLTLHTMAFI